MQVAFANKKLERLFLERKGAEELPESVYIAFIQVISIFTQITDEREIYERAGLRAEKLSGNRKGQQSVRLNAQFRLIYTIQKDSVGKYIFVIELVDYH